MEWTWDSSTLTITTAHTLECSFSDTSQPPLLNYHAQCPPLRIPVSDRSVCHPFLFLKPLPCPFPPPGLIRFLPPNSTTPLLGEPVDPSIDVGLATYSSQPVEVSVFSGQSILAPGERTGKKEVVGRLLAPLRKEEVGTIRCIGLNVSLPFRIKTSNVPECHVPDSDDTFRTVRATCKGS